MLLYTDICILTNLSIYIERRILKYQLAINWFYKDKSRKCIFGLSSKWSKKWERPDWRASQTMNVLKRIFLQTISSRNTVFEDLTQLKMFYS